MKVFSLLFILSFSLASGASELPEDRVELLDLPHNAFEIDYSAPKVAGRKFPAGEVKAFDPINEVSYQAVAVGKPFSKSIMFKTYLARYVTVYDKTRLKERISYLPYHVEQCHDSSFAMASWSESRTISVTLKAEVGFAQLGFNASIGMSITEGVTMSTNRNIMATAGIEAIHYPMKLSETWEGVTYIQLYDEANDKLLYQAPSRYEEMTESYPYEFYLDNQNVGFMIEREVTGRCDDSSAPRAIDEQVYIQRSYLNF